MPISTKSRIYVSYDGQNFFWVVYNNTNRKLIMNPTRDDLKGTSLKKYNPTNICPTCREEWERGDIQELNDKNILYPANAYHDTYKNGNKTEKLVCCKHGLRHYKRYDPDSSNNCLKSVRGCRTGNINPDSNFAKGDIGEKLTCILFGVKQLSIEYDNYELPIDHDHIPKGTLVKIGGELVDLSGNIPQTKMRKYDPIEGRWLFTSLYREWYKDFDIEILWCIIKNKIDRVYIVPKKKIYDLDTKKGISGITIYKEVKVGPHLYEKYRITDEEFINRANESLKIMLEQANREKS